MPNRRLHISHKLAVKATEAAKLLSLSKDEFLGLVDQGALPSPVIIGGRFDRWRVVEIDAALNGSNVEYDEFAT
mgnify:CR=1 FL=1